MSILPVESFNYILKSYNHRRVKDVEVGPYFGVRSTFSKEDATQRPCQSFNTFERGQEIAEHLDLEVSRLNVVSFRPGDLLVTSVVPGPQYLRFAPRYCASLSSVPNAKG